MQMKFVFNVAFPFSRNFDFVFSDATFSHARIFGTNFAALKAVIFVDIDVTRISFCANGMTFA